LTNYFTPGYTTVENYKAGAMKEKNNPENKVIYGLAKVSPKGQIVIPADLRSELEIKNGDRLVVTKSKDGDGILLLKMRVLNRMLGRYDVE
jgi:AbrB family looped-hinge helix DNA binding protein